MRPIQELELEICTLAGRINSANHRWLLLIAEFDRRNGWSEGFTQSCAHWLNWKCGIAMGAAREKVRVARALENLPKISAAMESGTLSYSKVREITRIAKAENESRLVMIAENGTAQHVEKFVRAYRRCEEAEELSREQRQQQNRRICFRYDDDGSLALDCRLPAEVGARFMKALDVALENVPWNVPAGTSQEPIRFVARRADAIALICESFLAHGAIEAASTDRHQIVVHVAEETLRDRKAGCCGFEDGPSMAAETARRLACDGSIVVLRESDDGEPLNLGRKTRTISTALWRALKARDKGCRFPGCANSRFMDAHHIVHWANGGQTKLSNLVALCRFHHRALHEGGITIVRLDDGALRFVRSDGEPVDDLPSGFMQPKGSWRQLPTAQKVTAWKGDRLDLAMAIEVAMYQSLRPNDVPAGTSMT